MALSNKKKLSLVIALIGAAAIITAAIITGVLGSDGGTQIRQQGSGNVACANHSQC